MNSGASTWPTKILAAVDRPTAPPTSSVLFQRPGEAAHDRRHDAPVEQQRRQHAHHQHHRQRLEGEDEIGARRLRIERQRAAADIAEHERGAGPRRRRDRVDARALIQANATLICGTLSISTASTKVTREPDRPPAATAPRGGSR